MFRSPPRYLLIGALAAVALGALYLVLRPRPVSVDLAALSRGPMQVVVEEEGKTRVKDIYTLSAPVTGKLLRIGLEAGDEVEKDATVVAVIQPAAPPFLDQRSRHEAEAQVSAAAAAVELAEAEMRQAESELGFAASELKRSEALARSQTITERNLEKSRMDVAVAKAALARTRANVELRKRELETARSRLIGPENINDAAANHADCCISVRSPVNGQVLKRLQSSETVILAGTPLVEIGDVSDTEIVVELLSSDAVQVLEGASASIEGWGGQRALEARVRRIEPSGFTKVSALGIEEQRVRTILDFTAPHDLRRRLGHDYRVFVRITTWSSPEVLRVPLSALFRSGASWAVFRAESGVARLTPIEIGHRNVEHAEVLAGLEPGNRIVLHPSDRVADGVRIQSRSAPELPGRMKGR